MSPWSRSWSVTTRPRCGRRRRCLGAIPDVSTISTAASGEELLARYPVERPDVVLLDVQMPGMGGCEAVRRLHELDRRVTILMLTSGESPQQVAEAVSQAPRVYREGRITTGSGGGAGRVSGRRLHDSRPAAAAPGGGPRAHRTGQQVLRG